MFLHIFTQRKDLTKTLLAVSAVLAVLGLLFIKFIATDLVASRLRPGFDLYKWLTHEDGVVENCEFVAFFVSFLFAAAISHHFYKHGERKYGLFYLFLTLALFYIAMEEISWGQRIIGLKTPEIVRQYNYQKEFNTHNLKGTWRFIHNAYILIGLYGAFAHRMLSRKLGSRYLFAPDRCLTGFFLPVALLYFYYDYIKPVEVWLFGENFVYRVFIHDGDQEPAELLLGFGILIFLAMTKYRQTEAYKFPAAKNPAMEVPL